MPDFELEKKYNGYVAGVDEAGRGPWAGPVVAGAVIIKNKNLPFDLLNGLDDSKKISALKREILFERLFEEKAKGEVSIGIGQASCQEIDNLNILQATFLAMKRAVQNLDISPQTALIDGNRLPKDFPCEMKCVIKGDALSFSIAAASIIAKVYRDHLMKNMALKYPGYGFEKNAGYGTLAHIEGLKKHGITPEHRLSYKPIQVFLNKK